MSIVKYIIAKKIKVRLQVAPNKDGIHLFEELISEKPLHMVRRNKQQKQAFREYVIEKLAPKHDINIDGGRHKNIYIGNIETAKVIFTAHYDTPATMPPLLRYGQHANKFRNVLNQIIFLLKLLIPVIIIVFVVAPIDEYVSPFIVILYFLALILFSCFKTNKNNYNDNTSGVVTVLETAMAAETFNSRVAYILFDNEELGKKGAKQFVKDNKNIIREKLIINFDCVGVGDTIAFCVRKTN